MSVEFAGIPRVMSGPQHRSPSDRDGGSFCNRHRVCFSSLLFRCCALKSVSAMSGRLEKKNKKAHH